MDETLKIEAAENEGGGKSIKITGVAYSGGSFAQTWDGRPIVLSLAGLEFAPQIPLLNTHRNSTDRKLGEVTASIADNKLLIEGSITSLTEDARQIVEDGRKSSWQLSMGADVKTRSIVEPGETAVINGRTFTGPLINITKAVLREVSVVAVGADLDTSMKIAAQFNLALTQEGVIKMAENPEVTAVKPTAPTVAAGAPASAVSTQNHEPAGAVKAVAAGNEDNASTLQAAKESAIKAERERVSAIQTVCNGEFPEIEKEAVSAGWTPEQTTAKVLATIRAERPASAPNITVKPEPDAKDARKRLEAALCLRCGIGADALEKTYGAPVVEAGLKEMDISLKELLVESSRLDGISCSYRGFDNDAIRASFSSVSLPGILSNVANKKLLQSFEAQPVIATKLCSEGDLNDFKENDRFRLTDVGDLKPVGADGELKSGGLVEESAKNQLETYGKTFCLTRKMIINDDLGAFMKVPTAMGNRAARLIDQLFFSRLLKNPVQADGQALFSTKHGNQFGGASSVLSADSLKKAIQMFLDQTDADGQPINVEPAYVLVPTSLKHLAIELTRGTAMIMAGGSENVLRPALNALADENLKVVSSPYLNNAAYAGSSATGWYLFGDPKSVDTWEIGYLKGKHTPTVERGETNFTTLGMWFRVYFDLGIREQDYRGMVRSVGA